MFGKNNLIKQRFFLALIRLFIICPFFVFVLTRCGDPEIELNTGDVGRLSVSEGLSFHFPFTNVGETAKHIFVVSNTGGIEVTDMTGDFFVSAFSYTGGVYPGEQGDCGETLEPDESCLLDVSFTPAFAADYESPLRIRYFDGVIIRVTTHPVINGKGLGGPVNP